MIQELLAPIKERLAKADDISQARDPQNFLRLQCDSVADLARLVKALEVADAALGSTFDWVKLPHQAGEDELIRLCNCAVTEISRARAEIAGILEGK